MVDVKRRWLDRSFPASLVSSKMDAAVQVQQYWLYWCQAAKRRPFDKDAITYISQAIPYKTQDNRTPRTTCNEGRFLSTARRVRTRSNASMETSPGDQPSSLCVSPLFRRDVAIMLRATCTVCIRFALVFIAVGIAWPHNLSEFYEVYLLSCSWWPQRSSL